MKRLFVALFVLFYVGLFAQSKGSGVLYFNATPTLAIDTLHHSEIAYVRGSDCWWGYGRDTMEWIPLGSFVGLMNSSGVPGWVPGDKEPHFIANSGDSLFQYRAGSWRIVGGGADLNGVYSGDGTVPAYTHAVLDGTFGFLSSVDTSGFSVSLGSLYSTLFQSVPDSIRLQADGLAGTSKISITPGGVRITTPGTGAVTIYGNAAKYAADYSPFADREIPDYAAVKAVVADSSYQISAGTGISITGTQTKVITNTGDLSSTNEIQTIDTFQIVSNILRLGLSLTGQPFQTVDLSAYLDNTDAQSLTFTGGSAPYTLDISGGADVTFNKSGIVTLSRASNELTIGATEVDGSITNEIQTIDTLSLTGSTLGVSLSGNLQPTQTVSLAPLLSGYPSGSGTTNTLAYWTSSSTLGSGPYYSTGIGTYIFSDGLRLTPNYNIGFGPGVFSSGSFTGIQNIAIGANALRNITSGNGNIAFGYAALDSITTGGNNVVFGANGGLRLKTGSNNFIAGNGAASNTNSSAQYIVAIGADAVKNTQSSHLIGIGYFALKNATTAYQSIAIGASVLQSLTTGGQNTGIGYNALASCTTCDYSASYGSYSLQNATTGRANNAFGDGAGNGVTTGQYNHFFGWNSGNTANFTGSYNMAFGAYSMNVATSGNFNSFFGVFSGRYSTGSNNIGIGYQALGGVSFSGSSNIAIGYQAGQQETTGSNRLYIENSNSTTPLIGGDFSTDRIGINTSISTLSSTLQITGSGATSSTYGLIVTNSGAVTATASLVVRDDGKVGIGTNAPAQTLHVAGTQRLTGSAGTPTNILGRDANGDISNVTLGSGLSLSGGSLTATGTPGGSNTQIQYNSSGSFAGSSNLTWDNTNQRMAINGAYVNEVALVVRANSSGWAPMYVINNAGNAQPTAVFRGSSGVFDDNIQIQNSSATKVASISNNGEYYGSGMISQRTDGTMYIQPLNSSATGGLSYAIRLCNNNTFAASSQSEFGYVKIDPSFSASSGANKQTALWIRPSIFPSGTNTTTFDGINIDMAASPNPSGMVGLRIKNTFGQGIIQESSALDNRFAGSTAIGSTSAPSSRLHITGSGATSATHSLLVTNSTPTTILAVRDDSKVGVLTSAPAQAFHVEGTARITGSTGTSTSIMGRDANGDISAITVGSGLSLSGNSLTATGGLPSTGLANRLTIWNGTSSIGYESTFYTDTTNNRLGLGTASPARTLDVNGEVRISDLTTDNPTKLVGADSDGDLSGVTIGTGLSFTGTTLNATGGAPAGQNSNIQFYKDGSFGADHLFNYDTIYNRIAVGVSTATATGTFRGNASISRVLLTENESGTDIVTVLREGYLKFGNHETYPRIFPANTLGNVDLTRTGLVYDTRLSSSYNLIANYFKITFDSLSTASYYGIAVDPSFAPVSINSAWTALYVGSTINQTGGSSGITRGIQIAPLLTSAYDYRALEISNTSGKSIYQTSTGSTNVLAGNTSIGSTNLPTSTLDVSGSLELGYVEKTTTYTAGNDYTINCTSGTFTVNLPTAAGITGRVYVIKNSGAGVITVDGNGSETIEGLTTQSLASGAALMIQSTGSNWIIL